MAEQENQNRENEERIITVQDQQQEFFKLFGYNNEIIWDCYDETQKEQISIKVKLILGSNENDSKMNSVIDNIVESIWNQRKYSGGVVFMSPIFILSVDYDSYKTDIRKALDSVKFNIHPLFRIRKCVDAKNEEDSHNCCMIFVDEMGRVYANWNSYLQQNKLPKVILIAPKRGIYNCGVLGHVLLEITASPECGIGSKVIQVADVSNVALSLGSTGLIIAGMLSAPVAAPVIVGASIVGMGCGAYSLVRSGFSLFDRFKHEESISLANSDARGSWIGVAGGITGIAAGGLTRGVSYLARNGQNVGQAVQMTVNTVNASAILVNGSGVANGFFGVVVRYRDDRKISALDVVQLSASLFLFTHSVYNFQTANNIIKANQEQTISQYREDLSKNQKRAFNKLAKETVRLQGGEQGRNDIIRSLKNIPDQKSFFRDVYKVNKNLNENNVRISFSPDGKAILNNAEIIHPTELRSQLNVDLPTVVFANTPPIPEGSTVSVNNELNLNNLPNKIDMQSLNLLLGGIEAVYKVFSEEDLRNNIVNFLQVLTVRAFNYLLDFVKSFITESGDEIQRMLHRIIPFEKFFFDIFIVIKEILGDDCKDISDGLVNLLEKERLIVLGHIEEFYNHLKTKNNFKGLCNICGGHYHIDQ